MNFPEPFDPSTLRPFESLRVLRVLRVLRMLGVLRVYHLESSLRLSK